MGNKGERYDLVGGTPYWLVRNGLEDPYPQLEEDHSTDVVIVGGGITGALCAFHLTESGIPCTVLDSRSFGTGSTSASTALLQYEIDTPLRELKDLVGLDHAVRSYKACARSITALSHIAVHIGADDLMLRPSVQYASARSHRKSLKEEWQLRRQHGFDVEYAEGKELQSWLPFKAPAAVRSTLGAELDAWRFTHALHTYNRAKGAQLFERTLVTAFQADGDGQILTTAKGDRVRAKYLIHATGYESQMHLPKPVLDLQSTYALVTEAFTAQEPWPDKALLWETATPYLYMRTAQDGRIIAGGRDDAFRDPVKRDRKLASKTNRLMSDLRKLFPALQLEREFVWCGTFGSTKDGLPYIDRDPRNKKAWFALGMGGNGITFSLCAAEIIRDSILGRHHPDADLFRFDR